MLNGFLAALVYDPIWVMNCIEYMGHSGTHICWYYSIVMNICIYLVLFAHELHMP